MKTFEYLKLNSEERRHLISNSSFLGSKTASEVINILIAESDFENLKFIKERMLNREDFKNTKIVGFFIEKIPELDKSRQYLVLDLIMWYLYRFEDIDEINKCSKMLSEILQRISNPFLTSHALAWDNHSKVFRPGQTNDIFDGIGEYVVFDTKVENVNNLVQSTINLLKTVRRPFKIYDRLNLLLTNLNKESKINHQQIQTFLREMLKFYHFPDNNKLCSIYSSFLSTEQVLYASLAEYRDHVRHSFNVFLLGLQLLVIQENISFNPNNDILCWVLTAFFHDIGYGIQEITKITQRIEENYEGFGSFKKAEFSFSESLRIFTERIIQKMHELIFIEDEDDRDYSKGYNYPLARLSPFLESWDKKVHGLMSAIIFLKEIDALISNSPEFAKEYGFGNNWAQIFLRSALAMSIHTFDLPKIDKLDVKRNPEGLDYRVPEALLPAFILTLFDSIEYLDRPRFGNIFELDGESLVKDVDMSLQCVYSYSKLRYLIIHIIAEYKNVSFTRLLDIIVNKIEAHKRLSRFISGDIGVKITFRSYLKNNESNRFSPDIQIQFLRIEEERFINFYESSGKDFDHIKTQSSKQELLEYYQDFIKKNTFRKNGEEIQTEEEEKQIKEIFKSPDARRLIPEDFSPQIQRKLKQLGIY